MYSITRLRTSEYTDGAVGLYVDYFANSSLRKKFIPQLKDSTKGYYLWIRAGLYYSSTPPGSSNPLQEYTIATEPNSRFHLPWNILLTNKNRFDWRFVNKDFKVRYRPRLTFEKEMQTQYIYLTPYVYGEYFVNFDESSSNRFRLCFGFEIKVALYINFESYFLYQFRNDDTVDAVNAVGIALKFYLDKSVYRHLFPKKKDN